ncbi:MAG: methylated-DNA--[protein]-cysteine S-methyltransferase [Thermomicrobiales bacterium]
MDAANQAAPTEVGTLQMASRDPDVDRCDLAVEAMPAHVVGDLTLPDERWLHDHTEECGWCANELRCYDRLAEALATAGSLVPPRPAPPAVALPKRDRVWYVTIGSPIGTLILAATPEGLREIEFASHHPEGEFATRLREHGSQPAPLAKIADAPDTVRPILERAASQLREYFGGERALFDVPLDWGAMGPFQRAVLEATAAVPFGALDTYAGIARKIGKPRATRAVGNALGRNPIPVIVPCHRIVRSDASLGGYTGGLQIKERLLSLEGVTLA